MCIRDRVYRNVSWLTEPSPDTKVFCQRRFGQILPLDRVLVLAKEQGWKVQDFYIAPKSDWHAGYYTPLLAAAEKYAGVHKEDSSVSDVYKRQIEAYVSTANCDFTDALAIHAIETVSYTHLKGYR